MFNLTTSDIYLLISITLCIICILPMVWLPVYKAEPDDAAEVLYYQRITAERTIRAKYEYAAWRMRPVCKSILLPALELQHLQEARQQKRNWN